MTRLTIFTLILTIGIGTAAAQQKGRGGKKGGGIPAPLRITVTGYSDGGAIPGKYGCGGGNMGVSPAIEWSGAPAGTQSFAIIFHDTDVALPNGDDVLHWAIYNIPGTATGLPENLAKTAELPDGAHQLNNIAGMPGFFNPCPPPPTTHHYIFEVYALDEKLDLAANATRADLLKAMEGHTRAKGTYVGTYHQ
jgi:Raf kinase inhibitor-like YbhB/YbcL family protein